MHPEKWFSRATAPEKSDPEWLSLGLMQPSFIQHHWLLFMRDDLITQGAYSETAPQWHKQTSALAGETEASVGWNANSQYMCSPFFAD